jgi:hypothetical protein
VREAPEKFIVLRLKAQTLRRSDEEVYEWAPTWEKLGHETQTTATATTKTAAAATPPPAPSMSSARRWAKISGE